MDFDNHFPRPSNKYSPWIIGICLLAVLLLINTYIVTIAIVAGNSMWPTLSDGEIILVSKTYKPLSRGDIILIRLDKSSRDEEYIVKRVVATGGETINYSRRNNIVWIDGVQLSEPYTKHKTGKNILTKYNDELIQYKVPPGSVFVLGDNRNNSRDSRDKEIGFIMESQIVGRVMSP